jgi:hypothetical protein
MKTIIAIGTVVTLLAIPLLILINIAPKKMTISLDVKNVTILPGTDNSLKTLPHTPRRQSIFFTSDNQENLGRDSSNLDMHSFAFSVEDNWCTNCRYPHTAQLHSLASLLCGHLTSNQDFLKYIGPR